MVRQYITKFQSFIIVERKEAFGVNCYGNQTNHNYDDGSKRGITKYILPHTEPCLGGHFENPSCISSICSWSCYVVSIWF